MALSLVTAKASRQVTVSGSNNLFQIAAETLGDATQWTRIARLNGLTDPYIVGIVTLKIPPLDPLAGNDGVMV